MDEYKVLKVKLNKDVKSHHCLYYKPHKLNSQKSEDESSNDLSSRTLFVYNVPPYAANETALKTVFSCFGRVEHVLLYAKPKRNPFADLISSQESSYFKNVSFDNDENEFSMVETETNADDAKFCFKVAYLVFAESEAVDRAQNKPFGDKPRFLQDSSSSYIKVGLKKWISDYEKEFVNEAKLSKEIDEFMKNYDEKKEQEDKEQDDLNQPDEDGWVTVTAKSRKSNRPFTEKNIEKIQKKQKKRKQQMQLVNFYSFQMKESKKEYIAQLRKKFEEDKKKIEAMKTSRKFKPF